MLDRPAGDGADPAVGAEVCAAAVLSPRSLHSSQSAAKRIVELRQAQHLTATMGSLGALLVNAAGLASSPTSPVEAASAVGAGDSFLAALVYALAAGHDIEEAFRRGKVAGAAATLRFRTDLARAEDVERFYARTRQATRQISSAARGAPGRRRTFARLLYGPEHPVAVEQEADPRGR